MFYYVQIHTNTHTCICAHICTYTSIYACAHFLNFFFSLLSSSLSPSPFFPILLLSINHYLFLHPYLTSCLSSPLLFSPSLPIFILSFLLKSFNYIYRLLQAFFFILLVIIYQCTDIFLSCLF